MSEKGESPPVYPGLSQPERAVISQKWLLALLFYAGAVTAALIVMATMGSIFVVKLEESDVPQSCDTVEHGPLPEPKEIIRGRERVVVDPVANKQVIYPSGEGLQGSIIVIDHHKDVIGIYMAGADECYLIKGVDSRLPNATSLLAAPQTRQEGPDLGESVKVTYGQISDWPVQDLTLLPTELHAPCRGKPVYWLERQDEARQEESGSSRQRRGAPDPCSCLPTDCWCFCFDPALPTHRPTPGSPPTQPPSPGCVTCPANCRRQCPPATLPASTPATRRPTYPPTIRPTRHTWRPPTFPYMLMDFAVCP